MKLCKSLCFGVLVLSAIVMVSALTTERGGVGGGGECNYTFHDRDSWGALAPTDVNELNTPVPFVVIHHTYIPAACYNFEDCSRSMRSMQNYHMSLGWGDIGYNFCLGAEGSVYEGRGWHYKGIHARAANTHSIGICLIGDWRVELPPPETLEATKALICEGLKLGVISPDYHIIGHMQVNPTECPGTALMNEIGTWPNYQHGVINFTRVDI